MLVLTYGSETMIWKEKERSRIRTVKMDRDLLGIRRMDKVLNAWKRQLFRVTKGLMKVFSDGSAMWRKWRMIRLLRGSMLGSMLLVALWAGHGKGGFIP